jgi:hypothetical protein
MSKVKVIDQGLISRLKQMNELAENKILVGIQEGAGSADDGSATLAEVGYYQEYGTRDIPARPWLSEGIKRADPAKLLKQIAVDVVNGRPAQQALDRAGVAAVGSIQEGFTAIAWQPNAASTIKAKGSSQPLIDTGRLRQSVSYKIIKGDG